MKIRHLGGFQAVRSRKAAPFHGSTALDLPRRNFGLHDIFPDMKLSFEPPNRIHQNISPYAAYLPSYPKFLILILTSIDLSLSGKPLYEKYVDKPPFGHPPEEIDDNDHCFHELWLGGRLFFQRNAFALAAL
jgi:hypothetical protein